MGARKCLASSLLFEETYGMSSAKGLASFVPVSVRHLIVMALIAVEKFRAVKLIESQA